MPKTVDLPAAYDWVLGEIVRLEQLRDDRYQVAIQANADIEHIDELLADLDQLRTRC